MVVDIASIVHQPERTKTCLVGGRMTRHGGGGCCLTVLTTLKGGRTVPGGGEQHQEENHQERAPLGLVLWVTASEGILLSFCNVFQETLLRDWSEQDWPSQTEVWGHIMCFLS